MSLRTRIAVTAAAAVAIAVLVVSLAVYGSTARRLTQQVDAQLEATARTVLALSDDGSTRDRLELFARFRERTQQRRGPGSRAPAGDRFLGPFDDGVLQAVTADEQVRTLGPRELPVDEATLELAQGEATTPVRRTLDVDGTQVRVLAVPAGGDGVLQLGLPIDDRDRALSALSSQLLLMGLLGVVLAAGLGAAVADRAVRPVRRLTDAAEEVGRTQALQTRIEVAGDDELGRLAAAFNGMLASLDAARTAQQELVADASHELRTPLTSLRTNIEVLQQADALDPTDREALLSDVTLQLTAFGRLVDGLVELARGDRPAVAPTPVALGEVVRDAVDRAAVFAGDRAIEVEADGSVVVAERDRLERAVTNLVDNAVKHGDGPVEVAVTDGAVTVRDHGHGFDDGDEARVFDRFYRSPEARGRPGSGLGLSIVAQVAEAHGGEVAARNHPGGGAEVTLRLPVGDGS